MRIGIGLPTTASGATMDAVLNWARRADIGPFSSLAVIDRLTFSNFDPLVSLTAAAVVTENAEIVTSRIVGT